MAAAKEKFVQDLNNKISLDDDRIANFSIEHMIREQENFIKSIRDYAGTAWIVELLKVYDIISKEICSRAEFGDMYKMTYDCNKHFEPDPGYPKTSTPKTSTPTKLCEPLHLKRA